MANKKMIKSQNSKNSSQEKAALKQLFSFMSTEEKEVANEGVFNEVIGAKINNLETIFKDEKIVSVDPFCKGEEGDKTVISVVVVDRPFLIDSFIACIHEFGYRLERIIHPDIFIKKDSKGKYSLVGEPGVNHVSAAVIYAELDHQILPSQAEAIQARLLTVLDDVFYATRDWQPMLQKVRDIRDSLKHVPTVQACYNQSEYHDFMQYLHDDSFTFLGYRRYDFVQKSGKFSVKPSKEPGLGLLDDKLGGVFTALAKDIFPTDLKSYIDETDILTISKIQERSTVHRSVPIDAIIIKRFDEKGQVIGEDVFIGLFTSITYSRSIFSIPLIGTKVSNVVAKCGYKERTHGHRALVHILEKYPRDEVFQMREQMLQEYAQSILKLQECHRIALYPRADYFGRYINCLVYIPRSVFDTRLRMIYERIFEEAFDGKVDAFYTMMDDSSLVRVLFIVLTKDGSKKKIDFAAVEQRLIEEGQDWSQRLASYINKTAEDTQVAQRLIERYMDAFPTSYEEKHADYQAYHDILRSEEAIKSADLRMDLFRPVGVKGNRMRLKLYHPENPVVLSDVLPILENMGVRIISEHPQFIKPRGHQKGVWIHDVLMEVARPREETIQIKEIKPVFEEALMRLWHGRMENDDLNSLILCAGLDWRQVTVLRAYAHYMRQIRYMYGQATIRRALNEHPEIAMKIAHLFESRFDPAFQKGSKAAVQKILKQIDKDLEAVASLEFDRVFRTMTSVIMATLRTNFYQKDKDAVSFKIRSSELSDVPAPKPWAEIFVYASDMEGVHLRGGPVARGGLRWSDRLDDFRTEVLGLMKAQVVKNAVIVPTGSKGGFVLKGLSSSASREERFERGVAAYKKFIGSLLDVTDNLDGDKVIKPQDVVCHDDDDPYLVVAADKGTATFSDIANGISEQYGFWLGDAFASGGSAGYDHKKMGITARGAWEAVKRHFRELGHDTQSEAFDVIGVGDMGGDVFGNGMLLSKHIRLIGAFNHLHIFCDPNPDPATSWAERKRLFDEVKGWDQYDEKKLSKGGRIYNRSDKELTLTREIQTRFGLTKPKVSPFELMQAMLKARSDLLWFGGIGTYIKDKTESHEDVSDKANDMIRIDAQELKARVIGEGANLGLTQKARISLAGQGTKVNTDFIDNSAGVNSSDQEVNIKILLQSVMKDRSAASFKSRNKLLEQMTENVAEAVLENNYQQTQALSLMEMDSQKNFPFYMRMMEVFEREIGLDRALEVLPSKEEALERLEDHEPLTRPELSVLLCCAIIIFYNDLLESDVPDGFGADEWLVNYFPPQIQKKYNKEILGHRLRREIIATEITGSVLNRLGPVFIYRCMERTGATAADVVRAYLIVRHVYGLSQIWDEIEALDNKVSTDVQSRAFDEVSMLIEHAVLWVLVRPHLMLASEETMKFYGQGYKDLCKVLMKVLPNDLKTNYEARRDNFIKMDVPKKLAETLGMMQNLVASLDIIKIFKKTPLDIKQAASLYYAVGTRFSFVWLRNQARAFKTANQWEQEALFGLVGHFFTTQTNVAMESVKGQKRCVDLEPFECWLEKHAFTVKQYDALLEELAGQDQLDLSMLTALEQRLRNLLG